MSPVNQATIPPSLGIVLAISARAFPAVAAAVILSGFIPETLSENALRLAPKSASCGPNLDKLFSPANSAAIPPSLGIILAISAKALAAVAAATIFSGFIPETLSENALRYVPNSAISSPNLLIEDPPVKNEAIEDITSEAVIHRTVAAKIPAPFNTDASIFLAPLIKG